MFYWFGKDFDEDDADADYYGAENADGGYLAPLALPQSSGSPLTMNLVITITILIIIIIIIINIIVIIIIIVIMMIMRQIPMRLILNPGRPVGCGRNLRLN